MLFTYQPRHDCRWEQQRKLRTRDAMCPDMIDEYRLRMIGAYTPQGLALKVSSPPPSPDIGSAAEAAADAPAVPKGENIYRDMEAGEEVGFFCSLSSS